MRNLFILVCAALGVSACTYRPEEVADPRSISLQSAVFEVADTLAATKERTRSREKVGLYVDEAEVTFNVAAKSTETNGLKLSASAPSGFIPVTASGEYSLVGEGSRGNTVTIKFKNVANLGRSVAPQKHAQPKPPVPGQTNAGTPAPFNPGDIVIMSKPVSPELQKQLQDIMKDIEQEKKKDK